MRFRSVFPLAAAMMLAAPAAASAAFAHTVSAGESLYSVAAADGLSVAELAAANGLSPDSQLVAGSRLTIPPQGASGVSVGAASLAASAPAVTTSTTAGDSDGDSDDSAAGAAAGSSGASSGSTSSGGYVVQPGDTLSAIAARAGTTVAALAAANGLDPAGLLVSGTVLQMSGATTSAASSAASASTQPVGASAQGYAGAPPYPTPEQVSASEVGSIASANGVPASLAQAIGWQESGFSNDLVSRAGARGVMQILPGTWDWIQRTLTAGTTLAPASATDNVRGGVLLLHSLLSSTGGDPALAAAGYYQGLPSVRQNGMYSDTQQYVNSVLALQRRFGGG